MKWPGEIPAIFVGITSMRHPGERRDTLRRRKEKPPCNVSLQPQLLLELAERAQQQDPRCSALVAIEFGNV
jgi:hypothetical protein